MTSLTGASGEDFASILRSLGYRMDRRPKPPEPPPVDAASAAAPETKAAEEATENSEAGSGALLPDVAMISDAVLEVGPDLAAESITEAGEIADVAPQEAAVRRRGASGRGASLAERIGSRCRRPLRPSRRTAKFSLKAQPRRLAPAKKQRCRAGRSICSAGRAGHDRSLAAGPGGASERRAASAAAARASPGRSAWCAAAAKWRRRRDARRCGVGSCGSAPDTDDGAPAREGRHSRRRRGGQGHGERHGGDMAANSGGELMPGATAGSSAA